MVLMETASDMMYYSEVESKGHNLRKPELFMRPVPRQWSGAPPREGVREAGVCEGFQNNGRIAQNKSPATKDGAPAHTRGLTGSFGDDQSFRFTIKTT